MQDNHINIIFNQLRLLAFSLYGQEPVKGAHRVAWRVKPGIYMPLKGAWLYNNFANKAVD